jgi:molybdate transport system regulatory protein
MMRARYNLWLEREGKVVLSVWRVRLLEAIATTGSITAAAEEMQVPYRRAWEKLQEMEAGMGRSLIETEVGGAGGGGASLTSDAQDLIKRFKAFADGMDEEINTRFQRTFHDD